MASAFVIVKCCDLVYENNFLLQSKVELHQHPTLL